MICIEQLQQLEARIDQLTCVKEILRTQLEDSEEKLKAANESENFLLYEYCQQKLYHF